MVVVLAFLYLHVFKMYASPVNAYRGSGLHTADGDAVPCDRFGQMKRCRFGYTAAGDLGASDMHQSVQERSGGKDNALRADGDIEVCAYPRDLTMFRYDLFHLVLPYMKVGGVLQYFTPCPNEFSTVALGARTPHGGSFRAVEHAELYGGAVGHDTRVAA